MRVSSDYHAVMGISSDDSEIKSAYQAIQVTVEDDDGDVMTLSFRGPIKRMTGMFAACGPPVQ